MTVTATPAAPSLLPGEDTGTSDMDGVINLSGPLLVGQTAPNAVITLYDNFVAATVASGSTSSATATADANGYYTIYPYPVLDDGKHTLTITAQAPGETASVYSPPLYIVIDTSKPDPPTAPVSAAGFDTGISALDGVTAKTTLQLTGTTEPNAVVALYNGSNKTPLLQATAGADGSYSFNTGTLADGVYSFTVKAMDLAGNVSDASAATSITVDATKPAAPPAPTLSPGTDTGVSHSDGLTNDNTPVVVGTAEASSTVLLYDGGKQIGMAQADASGNFAITTPPLTDGSHTLTVAAQDEAGNTGAASAPLAIDIDTAVATGTSTPDVNSAVFGSVPFTLHFSAPVTGLTLQALTLAATGSAVGEITAVSGSGSDYTVTVDGLGGSGTLALALAPGGTLTDEAGNPIQLTSTSYGYTDQDTPDFTVVGTYPFAGTDGVIATSFSGRLVAFDSTAAQAAGAVASGQDIYVRDLRTGGLTEITLDGVSGLPALSADGTTLVFVSTADDLVTGGPTDGKANVYVAHLSTKAVPDGQAVTVSSIQLVSQGNGQDGVDTTINNFDQPAISGDGTHVAFTSSAALIAGVTPGLDNVYEEDLATGDLTLISSTPGGASGDGDSDSPSLSSDGSLVAFESEATDLTGTPTQQFTAQSYVYNNTANTLTLLAGAQALGFNPMPGFSGPESEFPKISANGNWVTYTINVITTVGQENQVSFIVNQNLASGKLEVLTPTTLYNYDDQSEVSYGGRFVSYQGNDFGYIAGQPAYQIVLDDAVTNTSTTIASGFSPALTSDGNAITFLSEIYSDPDANGFITNEGGQLILATLGSTVGIDPVNGNNEFGASAWKQVLASGLVVTGITNAPYGSNVELQLFNITTGATISTLQGIVAVSGKWLGTLSAADLAGLPDGRYRINAVASATTGASFPSNLVFTVDTMAPATPAAPKLDAGSDTSLASDGLATNQGTPILTGTAEAGSTVTLYDVSGDTPNTAIGTAVADGSGVYAITAASLKDGKHTLDVTATDAAGNASAASTSLTITVDTVAPETPLASLEPASDTGSSDSDGITSNATPNITGTAQPATTVTLYDTDGHTMLGTATVAADGTYKIAASSLSDGVHTLAVTDTDVAGNVSPASTAIAVTIDTLPPLMPIITSVTGPLISGDITSLVTVNGTAEPNSKVQLILDGGMGQAYVFGESTAASDGDYSINSDYLPAGDGQNLTVIAKDAAGNASQPSNPVDVNIADSATPPPGVPPFTPTLLGLLTDGPIAGATVFADANGNGIQDTNDAVALTTTSGAFTLFDPLGDLEAIGGTDTTTGLSLPGNLFAPAGSTVIDPLTTLVYAYQQLTGDTTAASNAAVAAALGLLGGGATDLTMLDPNAAALAGSAALDPAVANGAAAVADAKLADAATDFSAALSYYATSEPVFGDFANVFTVVAAMIAALPAGGTLNLDDPATLLAIANGTAELARLVGGVPLVADTAAEEIVAAGNAQLDTDGTSKTGQALLTAIAGVETVDQGSAATALNRISSIPGLAQTLVPNYTGAPLANAAMVTASSIIDAPRLAASSNTGVSGSDDTTGTPAPTFVGTALPGTYVTLVEIVGTFAQQGQVLGTAQANALGHYSITSAPLAIRSGTYYDEMLFAIAAVGSTTDQDLTIGSVINLPTGTQVQGVAVDGQDQGYDAYIYDATVAAAPGDDAGHSALEVFVRPEVFGTIQIFADGGSTPIATRVVDDVDAMTLTTTPLSLGAHTLTVTETLPGGTVQTSTQIYKVTVTAATLVSGSATAVGPVAGGTVFQYDKSPPNQSGDDDVVRTVTAGDGAYTATDTNSYTALTLTNGYDTITGLPLGGPVLALGVVQTNDTVGAQFAGGNVQLTAPATYSAITAFSSIVYDLDTLDSSYDPLTTDGNAAATLYAFGLGPNAAPGGGIHPNTVVAAASAAQPALDLATLDPVADAEAGDTAPLLVSVELLDTASLLSQLYGYTFLPIAEFIATSGTINLDDPAAISAIIGEGYAPAAFDTTITKAQLAEIASVVAAGNAAIDAHAAAATSVADTISYALAAERVEQTAVVEALDVAFQATEVSTTDGYAAVAASYTGSALDQAILAERNRTTQVVSLTPSGAANTAAPSVSFTITFSEAVTALAAASFQLVTTGDLQGAVITGVTPVAGGLGKSYDVTVSTGVGNGTIALTYLGGGVDSSAGDPLTAGVLAPAITYVPVSYAGGGGLDAIATGDFNGDGHPDAVITSTFNGSSVTVYLNTGDGGFQAQPSLSLDAGADQPETPIVTDVNGDGHADIVIADYDTNVAEYSGYGYFSYGDAVTVLLGNGDGTFQQPINTLLNFVPDEIVAGDFNGDGQVDLASVDFESNALHILLGDGKGGFTPVTTLTTGFSTFNNPTAMATGDFNGDGKLDLAVSSGNDGTVEIFLGNGDGTFTALPAIAAGVDPLAIAVGDLNGDGIPDIAVSDQNTPVSSANTGEVTVLLGKGDGTFAAQTPTVLDGTTVSNPRAIAIGDLNNDGLPDIVVGGNRTNGADVTVLLANGDGTYRTGSEDSNGGGIITNALALTDVNGDGRTDILTPGADTSPATADGNNGLDVFLNEPETVVGSTSAAITVDRAAVAQPTLAKASGIGTLTQIGNSYTLDLGNLAQGAAASVSLALANAAAAPADSFDGLFGTPGGSGFTITGADLDAAVAAGDSYTGLAFAADTTTAGSHSETITFAPRDETATGAAAVDPDTGLAVTAAVADPDAVAEELAPLSLTVTDDVIAGNGTPVSPASLGPVPAVTLPNVRVGGTDARAIAISNIAAPSAAGLDVTATASGAATTSGAITGLQPGATDDTSLIAGLGTTAAGARSGVVTLTPVSDADGVTTPLASVPVAVSGDVFRLAAANVTPVSAILHVGDPGTLALTVSDSDPADGFSESLIAGLASASTGLSIASGGPTNDIAPGAADTSLAIGVSTAAAATFAGTATLNLTSDGGTGEGSLDGLGTLALAQAVASVSVTVDNYAQPTLAASGAALSGTAAGGYVLDLGTLTQGSAPASITLDTLNGAAGPADALSGSYTVTGSAPFTNTGFAAFNGDGAATADSGGTIALQTGQVGSFSETVVLHATGSNASGYSGALADQTVTVQGIVQAAASGTGAPSSVATSPVTLSVAPGAAATPIGITAPTVTGAAASALGIVAGALPSDGTVTLADGVTLVAQGETLTTAQLTGLEFTPASGQQNVSSSFGYTVSDPAGNTAAGVATLAIAAAAAPAAKPTTTPGMLTVAPGARATALGITAPTDPAYTAGQLAITVTVLPADGTVDLSDGTTPITLNQVLSVAQLTSLTFLPAAGVSNTQSVLGYTVTDPAANASAGSFTLAVGAAGIPSPPAAPVLTPGNLLSDVPAPPVGGTAAPGSLVTLLSNGAPVATAIATATGAFSAIPSAPLPGGPNVLTATATTASGVSAASIPVDLFEAPDQVSGISIPDASTRDVANALGQAFGLELTPGTQAVQLLDGTISVAPGTNEGFLARLYEGLFGRTADPATGYADDQLAMGLSRVQVATEFLATPEGQADFAGLSNGAFVASLAQGMLGRAFSAADQAAFTGLLTNNASRGIVLEGIADSDEAQAHLSAATSDVFIPRPSAAGVYEMYEAGLGRDGELAGVHYATNEVLQSGLTLLQVAQQIATTPEFLADHAGQSNADYVASLYQNGLGRAADSVGAGLTAALNGAQITRGDALFSIASSPEAAAYLTRQLA